MHQYEPPTETILVGPGLDPREHTPPRRAEVADEPCRPQQPEQPDETARAARRVVIALLLGILAVPLLMWGMVALNAEVTPATAIVLMGLVAFGAVGGAAATDRSAGRTKQSRPVEDEGRPVGCCPGPRPLRAFRNK